MKRGRFGRQFLVAAGLFAALPWGCAHDDDQARAEVMKLTVAEGDVGAAADRVVRFGRRALPPIEASLHTADVPGRKNLVAALRRIGDADAIPLLLHLASYDAATDVRREAEWTLKGWATGNDARAESAREALRKLEEVRQSEAEG